MTRWRQATLVSSLLLFALLSGSSCRRPSAKQLPPLQALAQKAAGVHTYQLRVRWEPRQNPEFDVAESFQSGADRVRVVTGYGDDLRPRSEAVVAPDEVFSLDYFACEVRRVAPLLYGQYVSPDAATRPVFLTAEVLRRWPKAYLLGPERVRGKRCQVVDLAAFGTDLSGHLEDRDAPAPAFIPRSQQPGGLRLWVDEQTGLVRKSARVLEGELRAVSEVVKTQQVAGFELPAEIEATERQSCIVGRVVEAQVNPTTPWRESEPRPPVTWLVYQRQLVSRGMASEDDLRALIRKTPNDAGLHYTLGRWLALARKYAEARHELRLAAQLAPDSPTPLLALARLLQEGKDPDDQAAIEAARQAVARAGPDAWYVRAALAKALARAGKRDQAAAEFRQLTAKGAPGPTWAAAPRLVSGYADAGDHAAAWAVVAEAPNALLTKLMGWWPNWLRALAPQAGLLDDLRAKAERAAAAFPDHGETRLLLARVLVEQGRKQEALRELNRIAFTPQTNRNVAWWAVRLAQQLGDKAIPARRDRAEIEQCIETGSNGARVYWNGHGGLEARLVDDLVREAVTRFEAAPEQRARLIQNLGRVGVTVDVEFDRAEAVLLPRPAEEITPAECAVRGALVAGRVTCHRWWGKDVADTVAAYLHRALGKWPGEAALWAALGHMRWAQNQWQGAATAYQEAAALDPEEVECPARAACALARLGRRDDALTLGRRMTERWADEWPAQVFYAALQIECGQPEEARQALLAVKAVPGVQTPRFDREIGLLLKRAQQRAQAATPEDSDVPINDSGRPLGRAGQSLLLSR